MPNHFQLYINVGVSSIIAFIAVFGNFLIIIMFIRFKELRSLNNAAITILSLSDFSRGCIVMTAKLYNQIRFADSATNPVLDEPICTITAFICGFTFVFSPMILALIAVIRYYVIVPWNFGKRLLTKTRFTVVVLVLFSAAAIFATLPIMGIGKFRYSQSHGVCFTDWCDDNRTFRTVFYIINIGVVFPILTCCYAMLFFALHKHNKDLSRPPVIDFNATKVTPISKRQYTEPVLNDPAMQVITRCEVVGYQNNQKHKKEIAALHPKSSAMLSGTNTQVNQNCLKHHEEIPRPCKLKVCGKTTPYSSKFQNEICESPKTLSTISEIGIEFTPNNKSATKESKLTTQFTTNIPKSQEDISGRPKSFSTLSERTNRLSHHISHRENRITRVMLIIFLAYCVCWVPAAVVNILAIDNVTILSIEWFYTIITMIEMKSAIDPILYGLGNPAYCTALKRMMRCKCCELQNWI